MDVRFVGFGLVEIDGRRYDQDLVIEAGRIGKRDKKASKPLHDRYGHTPLSLLERIPWKYPRLVVGTGVDGALPIEDAVFVEARRRGIEVIVLPTEEACAFLAGLDRAGLAATAAILHVTC
ncbi:MAG: hypothetical protein M0T75_07325 [Chloroflexi bacterium]|nr:hypothetical protein [Chloroflexota bacterium]